jgi:hypothetical protein
MTTTEPVTPETTPRIAKREYKLAADPYVTSVSGQVRREIVEITEDGHRSVILVVANDDAVDVLEALWRAYEAGRDRGSQDEPRTAYTHDADGAIIAVAARGNH